MRLQDYLSCLPNYETKWYSYSTDSIILSVSLSPGSEGRLRAPRSARSGHFLRSFHLQGSNPWPRYTQHPPIMDTELFFEARDSRRYIERDHVVLKIGSLAMPGFAFSNSSKRVLPTHRETQFTCIIRVRTVKKSRPSCIALT